MSGFLLGRVAGRQTCDEPVQLSVGEGVRGSLTSRVAQDAAGQITVWCVRSCPEPSNLCRDPPRIALPRAESIPSSSIRHLSRPNCSVVSIQSLYIPFVVSWSSHERHWPPFFRRPIASRSEERRVG